MVVAHGTPSVDGDLDDAVWQTACFQSDFEQQAPAYGQPPSHPIRVAVAMDDDTLYVAARMFAANADELDDALTQRDDLSQAERFIVSIDPSNTKRIAYSFAVSVAGVRSDWVHTDDTQGARDYTWNPVWRARTKRYADGWSAELAMPLAQLRLPTQALTSWGIDFNWFIPHLPEDIFWRAIPHDKTAWASMFGSLVEVPPVTARLGLELLPYVATRLAVGEVAPAAPAHRVEKGIEAGLDAKLRPLPGLVVAATLNPDFGQVDVDPAFVNLTAYEVRLTEKRPFFVENNALFADSPLQFFYSRRIGALPRVLPTTSQGEAITAIDLPQSVRILGAVAAGGYVASRTQVAALAALTDETSADAIVGAGRRAVVVAPLTAWSAARVEQQLGNSVIGATATAVRRSLGGTDLAPLLPSSALGVGADANLRTEDRAYELTTYAGLTDVAGSHAAIATIANGSAHYFQRPDETYARLADSATHLAGWSAGVFGGKRAGAWQGDLGGYAESPRYEVNDLGRLQSADDTGLEASLEYLHTMPSTHIYQWNLGGSASQEWNFGGMRKPALIGASGGLTLAKFSTVRADATFFTPGTQDDLTRGGPRMAVGWASHADLGASTPSERRVQLSASLGVDESPTLARGVAASARLALRATPALRFDLAPSLTVAEDHRQYVGEVDGAGGGDQTFGRRYLFGHLRRAEAALELRATWSLSPDLVLTLYAQPFASVGRFDRIGELAATASADVRWYPTAAHGDGTRDIVDGAAQFSIAEPDYTVLSLRSTAVLKWELRPGSTLFVVWQQARGGGEAISHPLHSEIPSVFTQNAIHTLAIKFSYWFG